MNNSNSSTVLLVPFVCAAGAILSGISLFHHTEFIYGINSGPSFCNISSAVNCDAVNASAWSTLLGLPLAAYGLAFYLLIFMGWLATVRQPALPKQIFAALLFLFGLLASAASVFLFFVSEYLIGTLCLLCLGMYLANFALLALGVVICRRELSLQAKLKQALSALVALPTLLIGKDVRLARADLATVRLQIFGVAALVVAVFFLPRFFYAVFLKDKHQSQAYASLFESTWKSWQAAQSVVIPVDSGNAASKDYVFGSRDAAIQLVEFVDFECPACRMVYREFKKLEKKYAGKIQIVLRNYPLDQACNSGIPRPMHQSACFLASLSRCAGEQGRFEEVTDYLFEMPAVDGASDAATIRMEALKAVDLFGLDSEALDECLSSERVLQKLQADIEVADKLGLRGTPSLWLNGKKVDVAQPAVVEHLIQKLMAGQR